jgi:hypothetical protein
MGLIINSNNIFAGKSEVKRPLGRHSDKGRIILKWFLGELVCEGVD